MKEEKNLQEIHKMDLQVEKTPDSLKQTLEQIDISCVQAFHTRDEINRMIDLATVNHLAAVFTLPSYSAYTASRLALCPSVHAGGVVSFPSGGDTTEQKIRQAKDLFVCGCQEIDMVMNLTAFRSGETDQVRRELSLIRSAVPDVILKVIVEAPQLTEAEIRLAVDLVAESSADYVKSSTGWYPEYPTKVEHIQIMCEQARERIRVKAAGGIRDLDTIHQMQKLGCSRFGLGMNSVIGILKSIKK